MAGNKQVVAPNHSIAEDLNTYEYLAVIYCKYTTQN